MEGKIFGILVLIFAVVVLVYIYQAGLKNFPAAPSSTPLRTSSSPSAVTPRSGGRTSGRSSSTVNPRNIPEGFTERDLSPHLGKVRISSVSPGRPSTYSRIVLRANIVGEEAIDITGWRIQGNRGSLFVPRAVGAYHPSGLTPESDLYVKRGHAVNIYSTVSPLGRNLRLNKCIGYLENVLTFTPRLGEGCPDPEDEADVSRFTGICQDYVRRLGSCEVPENPVVPQFDIACRSFLDTLNYGGCFDRHSRDRDFLENEWEVWTGTRFLDERHDRVLLYDTRGLIVDEYEY